MDTILTYDGIALDAQTALALLEWQVEMGVDEAMLDAPLDRFDLPPRPPAAAAVPVDAAPAAVTTAESVAAAGVARAVEPDDAARLAAGVAEAVALAQGADTLAALAAAQEAFDGIELKRGARRFCFADGIPSARVMIIGEAPGDEEDRQGRPFVGRAGRLLDAMFGAIGLSRDAPDAERGLYIANVLSWRPPGNRDPRPDEIAMSVPFLTRHVELAAPDLIVLMGNIPCLAILGRKGILRLRGTWVEVFGRPALPMTHPAYLLRTPAAKREAWADLLSLQARLAAPVR